MHLVQPYNNGTAAIALQPKNGLLALLAVIVITGGGFYFARTTAATPPSSPADPASAETTNIPYIKASEIIQYGNPRRLSMRSDVALVMDDREGVMLYGRRIDEQRPIASLTKLMTALIVIESKLPLDEQIEITREDRDRLRGSRSRLPFGAVFTRYDLLRAALGASDNRAAAALGRAYPGGLTAFVAAMNAKAQALGMTRTHYADSSGLDSDDMSTARDLVQLVSAVRQYPLFRTLTTTGSFSIVNQAKGREIAFHNTNRLVRQARWDIGLSKTGYTADAGNCLVMQANIANRPVTIVLLDSWGRFSRYGDAERIRDWLIRAERRVPPLTTASARDS